MQKYWRARLTQGHRFLWLREDGEGGTTPFGDDPHLPTGGCRIPQTVQECLRDHGGGTLAHRPTRFYPGEYYPRIWRRNAPSIACLPHFELILSSINAASSLFRNLDDVFQYVEPTDENKHVFGHEIRQLLLLACSEAEAQFKAIMRANHYDRGGSWNIARDYFLLARPLGLDRCSVSLPRYPSLGFVDPFSEWTASSYSPLCWYQAYNDTKHDRESNFGRATLENTIYALGAVFLLILAQTGIEGLQYLRYCPFSGGISEFDMEEHYLPPHVEPGADWHAIDYSFQSS